MRKQPLPVVGKNLSKNLNVLIRHQLEELVSMRLCFPDIAIKVHRILSRSVSDNPDGEGRSAPVQAKGRAPGRRRRLPVDLAGDILAGLAFAVFAITVIYVGAFLDYLGVLQ